MSDSEDQHATTTDADVRIQRTQAIASAIGDGYKATVKWGALVAIFYFLYRMMQALAGRLTMAHINVAANSNLLDDFFSKSCVIICALGVIFGIGGVLFGRWERGLRKDTVEQYHRYRVQAEEALDPNRSSSRLTPRGETRPEDQ